ncbi:MAG: 4Fe-4S dicluster domain-containing protein [Syntrophorhabdaceae bacterium]|nr:4Fe-4S dicluster domain-containing protein [Syntrophorhabdaceae bacterium]
MSTQKLKEIIKQVLPDVETVICWQEGYDKLNVTPIFITSPEQVDQVLWNPLCAQNLASYLPSQKKKVAVAVKGCDSRTIVQYMQEGLIDRNNVVIIGIPCKGTVSKKKVQKAIGNEPVEEITFTDGSIKVKTPSGEKTLALADVCPTKCTSCQFPTPIVYDQLTADAIKSDKPPESVYADVTELEGKTLEERKAYFASQFDKCIRCYACRNACPMCVCQDSCIAETRDPHWITQRNSLDEKVMFHMIHALHLAGRCVECGECERVCPMEIPVAKLKKKINKEMKDLFDYTPGVNPEDKPPMYTFNVDEAKIKEHKL